MMMIDYGEHIGQTYILVSVADILNRHCSAFCGTFRENLSREISISSNFKISVNFL